MLATCPAPDDGKPNRERFILTLEDSRRTDLRPGVVKLRSLLKLALRGLGFVCITARRDDGTEVGE